MERFAINILHKQIYKICRLCGVDQPSKVPILEETDIEIIVGDEEEATLAKKILDCVGIEVTKDDKMPQNICSLCVDKISDFYEYRLMCAATNLQTRTILNLPLVEPSRKVVPAGPKADVKDVKEDVKIEAASSSSSKKGKKRRGPPSPSPSPSPAPTTRVKAPVDVKDEPVPSTPVKALTKKERLKQLQQQQLLAQQKLEKDKEAETELKQTRSKRREPSPEVVEASSSKQTSKPEVIVPVPKKIKFEHPCSFCSDEFKTQTELDSHLGLKHVPTVRKFGCGSCRETFESVLEFKDHNLWHQLTRTPYTCFKCKRKWDKNAALVKHISLNACGRVSRGRPPAILPDVQCRLCNRKFKTQNLFEWHGCFLKPKSKCPKCDKYFVKKQILTRHYMMFCTGTLPPPEPLLIPKEEPAEQPAAPNSKSGAAIVPGTAAASAERRTRRSVPAEPELPKEEREIPFPPPLEPEPEAPASAPSSSGKKRGRPKNAPVEPPAPNVAAEKIATLLDTGSKLDKDTDIATINNLLSSVTEAIASISEAKAKKKKKKKDKTKDRVRNVDTPTVENSSSPVDTRTEEERQADEFAEQAAQLSMNEQLALCKMPMVVLAKTTFKQETTEIDTEPSQLQEPLGNGEDDDDNNYEESGNDYGGFQDEDDEEAAPPPPPPAPAAEPATAEEIPFPMPIKQEEEPAAPATAAVESESQPQKPTDKDPPPQETLFNEQLALNIKREPGLEEDSEPPAAKRRRAESRASVASPASSLSSSSGPARGSPKPTLILKIKKEKGLLNATVQEPISLDEEDDAEQTPERSQSRIYKKPSVLGVRIKQEKVDPAYERQELIAAQSSELPGGIRIKQERIDPEELDSSSPIEAQELDEQPARKKSRQTREPSPVIAFDGVRIKQEKPDRPAEPINKSTTPSPSPDVTSKPVEKKKKSKVKINPFALLKQRMAAEAAASKTSSEPSPQQSASPLPVITNVVGNAPPAATTTTTSTASSSTRSSISGDAEPDQPVPVIAQVQSIAKEPAAKVVDDDFPMPIKEEPTEESAGGGSGEKHAPEDPEEEEEEQFPMPIKEEAPEETPAAESPSSETAEEPEFPMPIKEEPEESQNGVVEPAAVEEPSATDEKSEDVPDQVEEPAAKEKDEEEDTPLDEVNKPATKETDIEEGTPLDEVDKNATKEKDIEDASLDEESKSSPEKAEEPEDEAPSPEENQEEPKTAESPEEQKPAESPTEDQESAEASPEEPSPPEETPEEEQEAESSPEQANGDEENVQDEPEAPQAKPDEPLEDLREESTSPISDTPLDDYEQNSQEPADEPEKVDEPAKAPESDLEELQNLLTEGLRPPDLECSTSTSAVANVDQPTNNALDVDLDSLLNNKLDEISGGVPAGQPDDLQLAIERELLNEMMPPPPAETTTTTTDDNTLPPQNNSNSELDVSKDLLAEGGMANASSSTSTSGNGHEQSL